MKKAPDNDRVEVVIQGADSHFLLFTPAATKPIQVKPDFKKRVGIGSRQDLLAKAIGHKKNQKLKILDLTAGLCRDSYHFVCLGHSVVALEASPDIYRVISAAQEPLSLSENLKILPMAAQDFLANLMKGDFDIIYFDPMFPEKKKSAKAGKESQLLKVLGCASDPQAEAEILERALTKAGKRVVVKRPLLAPVIGRHKPTAVFSGKAVRYDVYVRSSS